MRVLVLVPGRQVETLQASALIRSLAAGLDAAVITVACSPVAASLARRLEAVNDVLPLPALDPRWTWWQWLRAWGRIRHRRFDVAVVCGTEARGRLLAFLAGMPVRLGPSGGLTSLLLSDHVPDRPEENRAATWVRLVSLLGIRAERHTPRFEPGASASEEALVTLHSSGIADGRLMVVIAPGIGHSDLVDERRDASAWVAERWAHLANQLAVRHGAGIVLVGTTEDETAIQAASIDVAAAHAEVCGELDLAATAALLGLCDLVISADSPLLHLAAAVGTSAVGLYGPTDGRRRGPYGAEHRVIQALPPLPAEHRRGVPDQAESSMLRIRVEDVLAGIESSA